ncbi:Post-GPI attachment to proteins factor 3 [Portunus trituberculatus]|uniref:Post-GPI attachment to proteins factor 3 n=1 Tax=Portunus trituberculatus TaxID=210409 RepID=A0A5B7ILN9_PORTR|nr:Post-GPI attachment to proteins factor 3 [Portunus trituberculatus]
MTLSNLVKPLAHIDYKVELDSTVRQTKTVGEVNELDSQFTYIVLVAVAVPHKEPSGKKWPFARVWGMQEPASVFFSVLNLLAHAINLHWFRKTVPSIAPLYKMWIFHAVLQGR